jgi:hypothetical protein
MRNTLRKAIAVVALVFTAALTVPATAIANPIVPCDSDFDCFEKNPDIISGYTDKFRGPAFENYAFVNGKFIRLTDESPLWDCTTMGNHICGELVNGEWMNNHFDANGEYMFTTSQNRKGN